MQTQTHDSSLYLSNDDLFLMAKGEWRLSYNKMGAHRAVNDNGEDGYHFAVWAPDVRSVRVVGEFNNWNEDANYLNPTSSGGVWEGFIPNVPTGSLYKFVIETNDGKFLYKADPYGFYAEQAPGTASRTIEQSTYKWDDGAWMKKRAATDKLKCPLNIFEVHLGSWKRHGDEPQGDPRPDGTYPGPGDPFPAQRGTFYTYDDLAVELVDYVKEMGYSHIEVMPVMEHPFDGSWGYQVTGYYAPTSRYGNPDQFRHFIDACHQAGIGVILDWVPGGFCADEQGLSTFNGTMLYEKEVHPNWGTHKFDFSRGEVRSFLVSNLLYWIDEFHADGIRMDGVTSMLYLNFGVDDPSQKKFNSRGTEEDDSSIAFIRECNTVVGKQHPDVMMIAEESTAWPLVTYPPEDGGLGFNFKWDMGWMNDTLHYMQTDFPFRPGNHRLITFSTMYQFNENFVLPLSHDEVVNGKCSLITRMPGDWWRQFAGMRALAFYQMTHAGGKLNFMGNEIAQFIEWRYYEGIQYFLTEEYETHRNQQKFIAALNKFYNEHPALWQRSYESDGFEWIDADNAEQSIVSFVRKGDDPADDLVILINFDVNAHEDFRLGMPEPGVYEELFNSDAEVYGGSGVLNTGKYATEKVGWNGCAQSIVIRVPPLAGAVFKKTAELPKPKTKSAAAAGRKPAAKKATTASKKAPASAKKTTAAAKKPAAKKPATKAAAKSTATKVAASKTTAKKPSVRSAAKKTSNKTKE
ncbi:MAG: 1,4-alpha-glucan branching protein GlgB [Tractidigestivibacter sp.]|jgi:1,4-alpha-glucan branching enzyme|uniref:1,4-alpha-glucan branching protein GlgB n=1 Tax=Tractidigestivibacter sp. TaxID=2847320 RepID=UPI003D8A6D77